MLRHVEPILGVHLLEEQAQEELALVILCIFSRIRYDVESAEHVEKFDEVQIKVLLAVFVLV